MLATQKAKNQAAQELSQYELTTEMVTKLNTFSITPTAKLVLLYLTTCYNPKHADVFPKQKTIADKLGISEISVTRAIQELQKEGLILSERKYTNRYRFTSRIVSEQSINLEKENYQKEEKESINLIVAYKEHKKKEQIKQPVEIKTNQNSKRSGENVYSGDDLILYEYAKKRAKYNVDAFIRKIKENGGDKSIIKEYRKKRFIVQRAINEEKEQRALFAQWKTDAQNAVSYVNNEAWLALGKKLGRI